MADQILSCIFCPFPPFHHPALPRWVIVLVGRGRYTRRGRNTSIWTSNIWVFSSPTLIWITICLLLNPENTLLAWFIPAHLEVSLPFEKKQPGASPQSTIKVTAPLEKKHSLPNTPLHPWPTVWSLRCSFGATIGGKESKHGETHASVWRALDKWSNSEVALPSVAEYLLCGLSV